MPRSGRAGRAARLLLGEWLGSARYGFDLMAIELVKDQATKAGPQGRGRQDLPGADGGHVPPRPGGARHNRGAPAIQLAPPCIAGPEELEEIRLALCPLLEETSRELGCS